MNAIPKTDAKQEPATEAKRAAAPSPPAPESPSEQDFTEIHAELTKRIDWLRRKATLYIGKID